MIASPVLDAQLFRAAVEHAPGPARTVRSVTAALVHLVAVAERRPTLVLRFAGIDRFASSWPADRLVVRAQRYADAAVLAVVDEADHDGRRHAARLGARVIVDAEQSAGPAPEPFGRWFAQRFDASWRPWMLEGCVALAAATDRPAQAAYAQCAWPETEAITVRRRLRLLRQVLCAEMRDVPAEERRVALQVLRAYGREHEIHAAPLIERSLQHAARAIAYPPLREWLPVTRAERSDLLEVARAEQRLNHLVAKGVGRPPADAWRVQREQAIGRVASERSGDRVQRERERERIAEHLDRTILLIHDAWDDLAG